MRIPRFELLAVCSSLLFSAGLARAQQTQAPSLDIAGIKLGMLTNDALQALKADNPRMKVTPTAFKYVGFNDPLTLEVDGKDLQSNTSPQITQATETVQLMMTTPPNQDGVWSISRYYLFPTSQRPSSQTTLDALRKKYGPETIPAGAPIGIQTPTWVFDAQGKPVTSGGSMLNTVCQSTLATYISGSVGTAMAANVDLASPNLRQWPQQCASIIVLSAQIQLTQVAPNQYATSSLSVTLVDFGRYERATTATRGVIAAAVKAQQDKQTKQMDQVGAPKL
jgi:hypothetical protein